MFFARKQFTVETDRLLLRLPKRADCTGWIRLRQDSDAFLKRWEPVRSADHLSPAAFRHRVRWARQSAAEGRALPFLLERKSDSALVGAITLDNIRRGPAQTATLGYWVGQDTARQGYMFEALSGLVSYAFDDLDLSRLEAACLEENQASRGLLEKAGFQYEGVGKRYLQIAGTWRDHLLYARLRPDRR